MSITFVTGNAKKLEVSLSASIPTAHRCTCSSCPRCYTCTMHSESPALTHWCMYTLSSVHTHLRISRRPCCLHWELQEVKAIFAAASVPFELVNKKVRDCRLGSFSALCLCLSLSSAALMDYGTKTRRSPGQLSRARPHPCRTSTVTPALALSPCGWSEHHTPVPKSVSCNICQVCQINYSCSNYSSTPTQVQWPCTMAITR
jgi:hypothetical protein